MVSVEMTDRDAQAFMLFRKYQDKIALLLENQVFDLKNGRAELHFGPAGDIDSIDLHAKVFQSIKIPRSTVAVVKKVV